MRIIKRLYGFILQSFLPLFAMTFFIVLFIVLMQFLWKNIDDLVGKGLPISLIAELFFYAAVTMVPMALPLAILLASLMTFGNFGEKFELTAMKASGISLLHAMRPLIIFIAFISVGAFFFQNYVLPQAQVKMWTLLFSFRQKSPELEIPEGVFYDQIPGYNLFVQTKNRETGVLHNVMIYDVSRGGDNSTILLADSGRLALTPDNRYLYLHLINGEQFENLRDQKSMDRNVPFRREEFADKEVLIPFDAGFNRMDDAVLQNQYVAKDAKMLRNTIDSIDTRLDSTGSVYGRELKVTAFPLLVGRTTSYGYAQGHAKKEMKDTVKPDGPVNLDSLILSVAGNQRVQIFESALDISRRKVNDYQFKSMSVGEDKKNMRRHQIELMKKYTLSVACLIFFFIGAPLGAIIRKGGLGTPLVISVLLFIVYYMIDNTGYKLARDGKWPVWCGIWLSTFVLAPLGIYVTYKAMNDSAVFDSDRYKMFFRRLFGKKKERLVAYKEVIMNDISEQEAVERLTELKEACLVYCEEYARKQSYRDYWQKGYDMKRLAGIITDLEEDITYMTDCRNAVALNKLMDYPVVRKEWLYRPGFRRWFGTVCMWLFPIGLPVWLLGLRAQKNLKEELRKVASVSTAITDVLTAPAATEG